MNKTLRWIFLLAMTVGGASTITAQDVAVKSNAVHWAVQGSPNAAFEMALNRKFSADVYAGFNLWDIPGKRVRHWMMQPEVRYWFCDVFNGHFLGVHAHAGQYNVGGLSVPLGRLKRLNDFRYQGYFYGAGLSYGYQWVLSKHWNVEASLGAGYARVWYEQYPCESCGSKIAESSYNYWGVSKATLSLVYLF